MLAAEAIAAGVVEVREASAAGRVGHARREEQRRRRGVVPRR
jgi:hypothetical protein